MAEDDNGTLRTVAWSEICPWLVIFRTFRLAVSPRVLLLAAAAIFLTYCGWAVFSLTFWGDSDRTEWMGPHAACPWKAITEMVPDQPTLPGPREFTEAAIPTTTEVSPTAGQPGNPFLGAWWHLSRPVWKAFRLDVKFTDLACLLLCGLWALAIWAFFGGAITRIAAVQLASEEHVGWAAALRHARSKWLAYFVAPLYPLIGILLCAFPVWVLGLLLLPGGMGVVLSGFVWLLALLAAVGMVFLLLWLLFGWPLMFATVSAEGTDSFDGVQRSFSYLSGRPLHYLFYAIVATVFGAVSWLLVQNFAAGVSELSYWAASWGSTDKRIEQIATIGMDQEAAVPAPEGDETEEEGKLGPIGRFGAQVIRFWVGCVKLLAVGFFYGYFWTASTAIYFLLRRDVDATEMDEVFLEEDASEQTYGLPPLETDEAGAPLVSDEADQPPGDANVGPQARQ